MLWCCWESLLSINRLHWSYRPLAQCQESWSTGVASSRDMSVCCAMHSRTRTERGRKCQHQRRVTETWISNYIGSILWYVIIYPDTRCLLLVLVKCSGFSLDPLVEEIQINARPSLFTFDYTINIYDKGIFRDFSMKILLLNTYVIVFYSIENEYT